MVAVLKYIKNNNWQTIKADWKEYKELKRRCRILEKGVESAVEEICCDKDLYLQNDVLLKCIREPSSNHFEIYNLYGEYSYLSQEYCPHFARQLPIACCKSDCPYVGLNRHYYEMLKRYNECVRMRKNFWNTKMSHVK